MSKQDFGVAFQGCVTDAVHWMIGSCLQQFKADRNTHQTVSNDEVARFMSAIRIYPTQQQVAAYNEKVLIEREMLVKEIVANHPSGGSVAWAMTYNDARGLAPTLTLCVGSTIMLTQNLWTQKGLVNGTPGIVMDMVWMDLLDVHNMPTLMFVEMKSYTGHTLWRTIEGVSIVPIPPSLTSWNADKRGTSVQLSRQ